MVIFDAHLDLAWNALGWNRDLDRTVAEIRLSEAGMTGKARGANTVAFPDMRRGKVGIALATILVRCNPKGPQSSLDFRTQEIASAVGQGQVAYYRLLEQRGLCKIIRDWPSLHQTFSEWQEGREDAPFGFILSMEGADPIVSPDHAQDWYDAGLRVVGLAHYGPSAYAHGTGCQGGLTARGHDLLRIMEELNLILDLTHLADESFWEAIELFSGPMLASHNACRAITPGDRQFDDRQIQAIIERDGVIGSPFDAWMLVPGWKADRTPGPQVRMEAAIAHIDRICQLAGNARHVAIGSDLDGGFGKEQGPEDLDTIGDLQRLAPQLRQRGYSSADVEGIFHGNWLRFFRNSWTRRSSPIFKH
jgi:membrane dipeptidase